jgi:hypothetical protein
MVACAGAALATCEATPPATPTDGPDLLAPWPLFRLPGTQGRCTLGSSGGLAQRLWLRAPTLRRIWGVLQPLDAAPVPDPIHDHPQDASHDEAPQLGPL